MRCAAARSHGLNFKGAQARRGFAGMGDNGSVFGNLRNIRRGQRCDPAHTPEKIQRNAFSRQNGPCQTGNRRNDVASFHGITIADPGIEDD